MRSWGVPPQTPLEGVRQQDSQFRTFEKKFHSTWGRDSSVAVECVCLTSKPVGTQKMPRFLMKMDESSLQRLKIDRLTLLNSQNHIFHRKYERNAVYREDKNGDFWTILPPIYGTFFEILDSRAIVPVIGDTSWNEDQDCNIHLFSCRRTIPPGECVNIRSWSESKHFLQYFKLLRNTSIFAPF